MNTFKFRKLVSERIKKNAFNYLLNKQRNKGGKEEWQKGRKKGKK